MLDVVLLFLEGQLLDVVSLGFDCSVLVVKFEIVGLGSIDLVVEGAPHVCELVVGGDCVGHHWVLVLVEKPHDPQPLVVLLLFLTE